MVTPALLHKTHRMAEVNDVFNAVTVHGNGVGDVLFYGRGTGDLPTASAVLSDVMEIARKGGNIDLVYWEDLGADHLANRLDYSIDALVRVKNYSFEEMQARLDNCELIDQSGDELAVLVRGVNEGVLEDFVSLIGAAPYIRVFDC